MKKLVHFALLLLSCAWMGFFLTICGLSVFGSCDFGWPQALITVAANFYLIMFAYANIAR